MKNTWNLFQVLPKHEKKNYAQPLYCFFTSSKGEKNAQTCLLYLTSSKDEKNDRNSIPKYLVEPRNDRAHFQLLYLMSIKEMGQELLDMKFFVGLVSHVRKKPKTIHEKTLLASEDLDHSFFVFNILSPKNG